MSTMNDTLPSGLQVTPVRAFSDNYIWCIHDDDNVVVVDPGDADPVLAFLKERGLTLTAILITHHHHDHTGGITKLISTRPDIPVIGPQGGHIRGVSKSVREGDDITLAPFDLTFKVIEVPGHTLDHIAFYGHNVLFCGDTLFNGGCGRLFEGTAQQMLTSLDKLKHLPGTTAVYCAHEYTSANLEFAAAVEPDNKAISEYQSVVKSLREDDEPTVPCALSMQLDINPFMRTQHDSVAQSACYKSDEPLTDEVSVFAAIREWKDNF